MTHTTDLFAKMIDAEARATYANPFSRDRMWDARTAYLNAVKVARAEWRAIEAFDGEGDARVLKAAKRADAVVAEFGHADDTLYWLETATSEWMAMSGLPIPALQPNARVIDLGKADDAKWWNGMPHLAQAHWSRPYAVRVSSSNFSTTEMFDTEAEAIDYIFQMAAVTKRDIARTGCGHNRPWVALDCQHTVLVTPEGVIPASYVLMLDRLENR